MTLPGLVQDALQLYPYGNSGPQRVNRLRSSVSLRARCTNINHISDQLNQVQRWS